MGSLLDLLSALPFWVAVLRVATPLVFGTLGVLLCERAGVLNLGIEGLMVAGAFSGRLAVYLGAPLWGGVAVAPLSYFGYRVIFPKVNTPPTIQPFAAMDWLPLPLPGCSASRLR